jgi:hypothetical protein
VVFTGRLRGWKSLQSATDRAARRGGQINLTVTVDNECSDSRSEQTHDVQEQSAMPSPAIQASNFRHGHAVTPSALFAVDGTTVLGGSINASGNSDIDPIGSYLTEGAKRHGFKNHRSCRQ